jgi:hypothetical protein
MKQQRTLSILAALAVSAGAALANGIDIPAMPSITNPVPNQAFEAGTTSFPIGWTIAKDAEAYDVKLVYNARQVAEASGIVETEATLDKALTPGYYSLYVRGTNYVGIGEWSTGVTFIVKRKMTPDASVTNKPARTFKWTRSQSATTYLLKLAQFDKAKGQYVTKRTEWIPQPLPGNPKWNAPLVPDGKYRWKITDYKNARVGYTQTAFFQVKNSGHTTWNDPSLINGAWKSLTPWRWSQMIFRDDGKVTVIGGGSTFTRASWYADDKYLTMISDVTERCPYTVTETSLIFTIPSSGNTQILQRIP